MQSWSLVVGRWQEAVSMYAMPARSNALVSLLKTSSAIIATRPATEPRVPHPNVFFCVRVGFHEGRVSRIKPTTNDCSKPKTDDRRLGQELPINIPVTNTRAPPNPTCSAADGIGVSMYRCRIQVIVPNSTRTTAIASPMA